MADYFESGYCTRQPSWHSKELLLAEHPENWDAARLAAGLMWEPKLSPLYRKVETRILATLNESGHPLDHRAQRDSINSRYYVTTVDFEPAAAQEVVRDDTGAALGTVSERFELLYHRQMGPIVEAILDNPNAKFDTAGSVRGGKQVYVTVLLDEPTSIVGDSSLTLPYLVLLNSHDGSGACKALFTSVRVVCANTFAAADMEGERTGAQFTFRHTAGISDRIAEAKMALRAASASTMAWVGLAEQLSTVPADWAFEQVFIEQFLPTPPTGTVSDRVLANIDKDRSKFRELLQSRTNGYERGTGLGLVNTAVEYLDFARGYRNAETLMGRQLLRSEPLKAKAVKIVRELASI